MTSPNQDITLHRVKNDLAAVAIQAKQKKCVGISEAVKVQVRLSDGSSFKYTEFNYTGPNLYNVENQLDDVDRK